MTDAETTDGSAVPDRFSDDELRALLRRVLTTYREDRVEEALRRRRGAS